MNWDKLKLPNGWIAVWGVVVALWAAGWAATGTPFFALKYADAFLDWLTDFS